MLKLCSCFRATNNDRHKHKQIGINSNDMKEFHFGLFLTGDDESGKTKIIEAFVASHDPFTLREKILKTSAIERYIRGSLADILHAFEQSNPSVKLEYPENQQSITYILTTAQEAAFDYPLEFFQHAELLWTDAGLQTFLKNSNKYRFPDSAKYFLNQLNRIRDPDYVPSTEDMIQCRLFPSHTFKMSIDLDEERVRFNLLEMDLLHEDKQESIQSLCDNTNAIIFITDCSCYNIMTGKKGGQTRLHRSLELFKKIRNNKLRQTRPVILLLNKQDLFAKKIKTGVRLEDYFPDFTGYVLSDVESRSNTFLFKSPLTYMFDLFGCFSDGVNPEEDPEVTRAKYFIRDQFRNFNLNCYCHFTCDSDLTIHLIFGDCTTIFQQMLL